MRGLVETLGSHPLAPPRPRAGAARLLDRSRVAPHAGAGPGDSSSPP